MAVLMIDQYREIGGGQTVFLQAMESLLNAGLQVEAALPLGGGLEQAIQARFGGRVRCHGIPVPELSAGRKTPRDALELARYSARLLRLRKLVSGFDTIYVNGPRLFPLFLALSSVVRARFVYHVHLDHSRAEKLVVGALLRHPRTHAVLVNSRFVLRRLERTLGPLASGGKLKLLENTLTRSLSGTEFTDRWSGTESPKLKAVVIGRLVPEKGQDLVVDLATKFSDVEFHVLGDADFGDRAYADELKARAAANVLFHGRVADVPAEIEKIGAQINLVPSRWEEPFGLSAIEGMACSCLTITSGRGGLADIAEQTGAWTASGPSEWERTIERIRFSTPAEMLAQARQQHRKTLSQYSCDRFDRQLRTYFA